MRKQLLLMVLALIFSQLLSSCATQTTLSQLTIPQEVTLPSAETTPQAQFAWLAPAKETTAENSLPELAALPPQYPVPFVDMREGMRDLAEEFLGRRYRLGGQSVQRGFDCSGFTSHVLGEFGYKLPRTSRAQATVGEEVSLDSAQTGDLLFFGHRKRYINHTALVVSEPGETLRIIHATRRGIVEDTLNSPAWRNYYAKRFMFARKVLEDETLVYGEGENEAL